MKVNVPIAQPIIDWVISSIHPGTLSSDITDLLYAWQAGEKIPTYNQIERVSKATGIPLGYFFLKTPPEEDKSFVEYRTVDSVELCNPSRNLMDTMHDMKMIQDWVKNEQYQKGHERLSFVNSVGHDVSINQFASYVRELLQLKVDWFEESRNVDDNFRLLRNKISSIGTIVMLSGIVGNNTHRALDTNEFRAFALVDISAPLIFINSNDSANGKIFSLLHEFAHICLGENSLFNDRYNTGDGISPAETLCNALAAEILVPEEFFIEKWQEFIAIKDYREVIAELAKYFRCGETVIARRALDHKYISDKIYKTIARQMVQYYLDSRRNKSESGGDFYRTAASRIDRRFFDMLLGSVHEGKTLYSDAFRLTNTNRSTFANLAEKMGGII